MCSSVHISIFRWKLLLALKKYNLISKLFQFYFRKSQLNFRILYWILENLTYISENVNCISENKHYKQLTKQLRFQKYIFKYSIENSEINLEFSKIELRFLKYNWGFSNTHGKVLERSQPPLFSFRSSQSNSLGYLSNNKSRNGEAVKMPKVYSIWKRQSSKNKCFRFWEPVLLLLL